MGRSGVSNLKLNDYCSLHDLTNSLTYSDALNNWFIFRRMSILGSYSRNEYWTNGRIASAPVTLCHKSIDVMMSASWLI